MTMRRLAVIVSHPTQYYSPWFRYLAEQGQLVLKVFYLWDFGVTDQVDRGFGSSLKWDLPLLEGYEFSFVSNSSRDAGTHHFSGLRNPELRQQLQEYSPDAVLLFGHGWWTHSTLLVEGAPRGAALLYRGDSHMLGPKQSVLKDLLRRKATAFLLRKVDHFLPVGKANAEYLRAHGVADERMTFVPHCVDNDRFRADGSVDAGLRRRRELGIAEHSTVVLFAGKFEEKKRPLDVVKAFRSISNQSGVLLMVGAGPEQECVTAAAEGDHRIRFLPFQNQTEMPSLYAAADLFVLASFSRQETWGLAVNEAMNCRCGLIVSDHVGCAGDLVIDGENGRVFAAGDQYQLEQAMREAFEDSQLLARWQQRSLQIVDRYSYRAASRGLHQALEVTRTRGKS